MLRLAVALCTGELESVTRTVNEKVPVCVGVPEIWPDGEITRPGGNEPDVIDQLYGAVPPLTDKVAE